MENIKVFKLLSGEEIMATDMDSAVNGKYVLENPAIVVAQRSPQGEVMIGLAHWPIGTEMKKGNTFEVSHSAVILTYTPSEDLQLDYNKIFGAGLVVPGKKLILG